MLRVICCAFPRGRPSTFESLRAEILIIKWIQYSDGIQYSRLQHSHDHGKTILKSHRTTLKTNKTSQLYMRLLKARTLEIWLASKVQVDPNLDLHPADQHSYPPETLGVSWFTAICDTSSSKEAVLHISHMEAQFTKPFFMQILTFVFPQGMWSADFPLQAEVAIQNKISGVPTTLSELQCPNADSVHNESLHLGFCCSKTLNSPCCRRPPSIPPTAPGAFPVSCPQALRLLPTPLQFQCGRRH